MPLTETLWAYGWWETGLHLVEWWISSHLIRAFTTIRVNLLLSNDGQAEHHFVLRLAPAEASAYIPLHVLDGISVANVAYWLVKFGCWCPVHKWGCRGVMNMCFMNASLQELKEKKRGRKLHCKYFRKWKLDKIWHTPNANIICICDGFLVQVHSNEKDKVVMAVREVKWQRLEWWQN